MEIKKTKSPFQRFKGLLNVDRKDISHVYIYAIFLGLTNLSLPLGIQSIINLIQMGKVSTSWIVLLIFVVAGVIFGGFLQIMQLRITENIQQKIFVRSSFEFAYRIPRFKLNALEGKFAPELVNRFFDTMTIQKGLPKILIDFSSAALQIVFGLILLSVYHPFFIVFSFFLLTILIVLIYFSSKRGLATSLLESKYKYAVAYWLEELAHAMNTFRLAGKTDYPSQRTDELVSEYVKYRESHFRVLLSQFMQLVGFKALIAFGLLLIGGMLVINQTMNIGQFIAAEIIILLVISSVEKVIINLENIYDVLTAVDKLGYIMDIPLEKEIKNKRSDLNLNEPMKIEMDNVSFSYPGSLKNVLEKFNLTINPGQHTILLGENGSGKTSVLNAITGLYPISHGALSYDNISFGNMDVNDLRSKIGDVTEDEHLFSASIHDNICIGRKDITLDDLMWACDKVNLTDYIKTLPDGFSTLIDPNGRFFSRTIHQKILLARSIANRPKLLLLDDSQILFNARLIHSLTEKENPWTLIAVTENEDLLSLFTQIVVVKNGNVAFAGDFETYQQFKSN